jgi:hypothetical protein
MQEELKTTSNNLRDIITWLNQGFIICLYSDIQKVYYYSRESIAEITDEKIVYIDISENPRLLDEDEWPYYIKREGFQEYKSTDKLPINPQNIYNYKIEFKINFVNK